MDTYFLVFLLHNGTTMQIERMSFQLILSISCPNKNSFRIFICSVGRPLAAENRSFVCLDFVRRQLRQHSGIIVWVLVKK